MKKFQFQKLMICGVVAIALFGVSMSPGEAKAHSAKASASSFHLSCGQVSLRPLQESLLKT